MKKANMKKLLRNLVILGLIIGIVLYATGVIGKKREGYKGDGGDDNGDECKHYEEWVEEDGEDYCDCKKFTDNDECIHEDYCECGEEDCNLPKCFNEQDDWCKLQKEKRPEICNKRELFKKRCPITCGKEEGKSNCYNKKEIKTFQKLFEKLKKIPKIKMDRFNTNWKNIEELIEEYEKILTGKTMKRQIEIGYKVNLSEKLARGSKDDIDTLVRWIKQKGMNT